jgi:hypothetical protein
MIFLVHTPIATFKVEAPSPKDARKIIADKNPFLVITKVKLAAGERPKVKKILDM